MESNGVSLRLRRRGVRPAITKMLQRRDSGSDGRRALRWARRPTAASGESAIPTPRRRRTRRVRRSRGAHRPHRRARRSRRVSRPVSGAGSESEGAGDATGRRRRPGRGDRPGNLSQGVARRPLLRPGNAARRRPGCSPSRATRGSTCCGRSPAWSALGDDQPIWPPPMSRRRTRRWRRGKSKLAFRPYCRRCRRAGDGHPARLSRGLVAVGDRRTARRAARDREDENEFGVPQVQGSHAGAGSERRTSPEIATLMSFAGGGLTEPFAIVVASHARMCPRCRL